MQTCSPTRKLAAILSADLIGFSRMMSADEAGTLRDLQDILKKTIEPIIGRHGGRIVKLVGDGILVEFSSAVGSVNCALEWQESICGKHQSAGSRSDLRYRIGIHLGDVIISGEDLFGDGVNLAARLERMCPPGGICVSVDLYRQVRGKVDASFRDLGVVELKNIPEPVQVFAVARGGDKAVGDTIANAGKGRPAIAVLPFIDISHDSTQGYFADGMTEDIITNLSRFRELIVIGRSSCFCFKGTVEQPTTIANQLGVHYLVEGSVRTTGDRVRLSVRLVDPRKSATLWSETFDRMIGDIFAVQDEVCETVAQTVVGRVRSISERKAVQKPLRDSISYDYVLKARAIIWDSRGAVLQSRHLYEKAIALDPGCVQAFTGLAATYSMEWTSGWSSSREETLAVSLGYASKAVALDDQDSEAQRRVGVIHLFNGDLERCIAHLDRALLLNPNDSEVMAYRALHGIYTGKPAEALAELDRATRRNPFHPNWFLWFVGLAHFVAQDYEKAVPPLLRAIEAYPNFVTPHRHLAACYARLGNMAAAQSECEAVLSIDPAFSIGRLMPTLPYSDAAVLEHYCESLRLAGLPD